MLWKETAVGIWYISGVLMSFKVTNCY